MIPFHKHKFGKEAPKRLRGTEIHFYRWPKLIDAKLTFNQPLSKKEGRHVTEVTKRILKSLGFKGETKLDNGDLNAPNPDELRPVLDRLDPPADRSGDSGSGHPEPSLN